MPHMCLQGDVCDVLRSHASRRLVKRALGQSRPVYALFVSRKEMEEKATRLPQVDGYGWVVAENLPAEAVILKLSPK